LSSWPVRILIFIGLLSSRLYAENHIIPDSLEVAVDYHAYGDTIEFDVIAVDTVTSLWLTDFSDSSAILIECVLDGQFYTPVIEYEDFDGLKLTRFVIDHKINSHLNIKYRLYNPMQLATWVILPGFGFRGIISSPDSVSWLK
jgi:hypothetical protein